MRSVKQAVLKATDAKLKSDNWQYVLDCCDLVSEDPEDGGTEAMEVVGSRLAQKDANVILRTLTLVTSLAENCGSRLQQLIASKDFTGKLWSLVESKKVHITVKMEVARVVKQLSATFKGDPSLRYMNDLCLKLSSTHPELLQDNQPNVPEKHEMSHQSKRKEDRDLEEALRLSLLNHQEQEKQTQTQSGLQLLQLQQEPEQRLEAQQPQQKQPQKEPQKEQLQQEQPPLQDPSVSANPPKRVKAIYDLTSSEPDELTFKKGDVILVLEQVYRDWWRGSLRGSIGIFPLNYVAPMAEPTEQELQLEVARERELFAQKHKVDQLYHKMTDASGRGEDPTQDPQVNELYGSVTPLRPEVARTISKYVRKREDLLSLRQVLANAEVTYNQLIDRATNSYAAPVPMQPLPRSNQRPRPDYSMPYSP